MLFRQLIHFVTLISLIVSISYAIYYTNTKSHFVREISSNNQQVLMQIASSYEVFISNTIEEAMMYMEMSESTLVGIGSDPVQYSDAIYNALGNIQKISNYISNIYYFTKDRTEVYVSDSNRSDWMDFHDRAWLDSLETTDSLKVMPSRFLPALTGGEKEVIPVAIHFPLHGVVHTHTYVLNLDAGRLFHDLVQKVSVNPKHRFSIMDASGQLFVTDRPDAKHTHIREHAYMRPQQIEADVRAGSTAGGFTTELQGKKVQVSYYNPPGGKLDWIYVSEVEFDAIASNMVKPLKIIVAISLISVVLSVAAAVFVSNRMFHPIRDIVRVYGRSNGGEDSDSASEFEIIRRSFLTYAAENSTLKQTVNDNVTVLKEQFCHNLIVRSMYAPDQIAEKSELFGIPLAARYVVLVMEIEDIDRFLASYSLSDRLLYEFALKNIAVELLNERGSGFIADLDTHRYAVAFGSEAGKEDRDLEKQAAEYAGSVQENVQKYLKFSVRVGIGLPVDDIRQLNKSYKEAVSALTVHAGSRSELTLYRELQWAGAPSEFYPEELERQLVQVIMVGDSSQAVSILTDMFRTVDGYSSITKSQRQVFALQLVSVFMKQLTELGGEEDAVFGEYGDYAHTCGMMLSAGEQQCRDMLVRLAERLCHHVNEKRANVSNAQVQKIMEYIHAHYHRQLSMDIVADVVGLNRSYVGRLFKQYTNMSMVDYVNALRIQKAVEYLQQTDKKVFEIAEEVGYNNTQYFIKLFKQATGMTPGQYKEKLGS